MRDKRQKTELLAPAGSYETLRAVIEAGCDAVYIGGMRFGARAYADNPDEEMLLRGIDEAHLRGVKVYLTVNTILKNTELAELREYLLPYYEAGLDAVIVQDFGVMKKIAEWFPSLPIHASTQMTITEESAALLLPPQVTRIVPARELSISEIARMAEATDKELEIFVHGALCYCYSGQCLLSSLAGGRSGNRGRCAQPCRKRYTYEEKKHGRETKDGGSHAGREEAFGFLLSPKDQCLLPRLHELLATGIDSLKLEGRMKKPEYAAGVTAIYRRWLDRYEELGPEGYEQYLHKHKKDMADDVATLAELYNRGGFCEGYAFDTKGRGMMCVNRPNHTGVLVGTGQVVNGVKPVAILKLREELGPEEVLEVRTPDGFVCTEITTPKDMSKFDPAKPVALHREAMNGAVPETVYIFRTKNQTLLTEIREQFLIGRRDLPVIGTLRAQVGEPLRLTVTDASERACVTVTGEPVAEAKQTPTTAEQVLDKLRRTGGSGYTWEELTVDIGDGVFLPVSQINELRREALAAYETAAARTFHRTRPAFAAGESGSGADGIGADGDAAANASLPEDRGPACMVVVSTAEQTEAALRHKVVTDLCVDMEGAYEACLPIIRAERGHGSVSDVRIGIALPRVSKGAVHDRVCAETERIIKEYSVDFLLVRTPDQLAEVPGWRALRPSLHICTDNTLYVANDAAAAWLSEAGADAMTISAELRRSEVSYEMAGRSFLPVYERQIVMISEQCPHRTAFSCKNPGSNPVGTLTDMEGNTMPVKSICRYCHSLIGNAAVTSLLSVMPEVLEKKPCGVRVAFFDETRREADRVLRTLATALAGQPAEEPSADGRYTKGHWKRGVM